MHLARVPLDSKAALRGGSGASAAAAVASAATLGQRLELAAASGAAARVFLAVVKASDKYRMLADVVRVIGAVATVARSKM
eukprot:4691531-Pleurochrysis_carterae.AAC.1